MGGGGAAQRNILNRSIGADEYDRREAIIRAVLQLNPLNVPLKVSTINAAKSVLANKFGKYLAESYVARNLRRLIVTNTGYALEYDAYGEEDDSGLTDEDLLEFQGT